MIDHRCEHLNRYWHKFDACPRCGVEAGDICIDQRFPHKIPWRRTLKPHTERPRLDGQIKKEEMVTDQTYPGFEGSTGPGPGGYGKPHVYARDVQSGAGNCVCGRDPFHPIHPELVPGVPNPELPTGS